MTKLELHDVCKRAGAWAREAGALARDRFGSAMRVSRKPDTSVLTEIDLRIERRLTAVIADAYPDHRVLGEESFEAGALPDGARYTWVLDPLDGTRNYAHGFPAYSTSLALLDRDQPVLGLIYAPVAGRLYRAVREAGAWVDDDPLDIRGDAPIADLLIAFPGGRNLRPAVSLFDAIGQRVNLRNVGSTCLHLALVGCGALDAAYGHKAKLWDIAAGALIVEEAGGIISGPDGKPLFPFDPGRYRGENLAFVASRPGLHEAMLQAVGAKQVP